MVNMMVYGKGKLFILFLSLFTFNVYTPLRFVTNNLLVRSGLRFDKTHCLSRELLYAHINLS